MKFNGAVKLIIIGVFLLLIGAILPFLMVIRMVSSVIGLSIVAYVSSVAGLVVGMVGVAEYMHSNRNGQD